MRHAAAAAALAAVAVVYDALTAHAAEEGAPASLRGSSLVLSLCLAAPLVQNPERGYLGRFQRPLLALLLCAVALVGRHTGADDVRVADAFFVVLVSAASIGLYCAGGVDAKAKNAQLQPIREDATLVGHAAGDPCRMLCAALVLYASLRILRAAVLHPVATREFDLKTVDYNGTLFTERGYAASDEGATVWGVVAGVVGACTALLVWASNSPQGLRLPLTTSAAILATAALGQTLSIGRIAENLAQVFAHAACGGANCDAAHASRRFAVANAGAAAATWALAAAATVLAAEATASAVQRRLGWIARLVVGGIAGFFCIALCLAHVQDGLDEGRGAAYDYALLASVAGAAFGYILDAPGSGTVLWLAGFAYALLIELTKTSVSALLADPIRFGAFASGILSLCYILVDLPRLCLFGKAGASVRASIDSLAAVIAVTVASIGAACFFLSIALLSAYDGGTLATPFTGRRYATVLVVEGCSLLGTVQLLAEAARIGLQTRAAAWVLGPVLAAAFYATAVAANRESVAWETVNLPTRGWTIAAALGGGALVPWAVVGFAALS
jgi:hypothetical protein